MKAITTWRFTSPDRAAIDDLAQLYGGRARPWSDPKASPRNQFEVITDSSSINVWIPSDAYTMAYELWGGRGCERRCDGETVTMVQLGKMRQPCICNAEGEDRCKPYSRLSVILPDIAFGGVWRLEVKGWTFAAEAPGMVAMIADLQAQGLVSAKLVLTQRSVMSVEGVHHFVVPQFSLDASPAQLSAGVSAASLPSGTSAALPPAPPVEDVFANDGDGELVELLEASVAAVRQRSAADDDDIEDAVLVDDGDQGWDIPPPNVKVKRNPDRSGRKWVRA